MARTAKDSKIILALFFGYLLGIVMAPIGLIPNRDLNDYRRLEGGAGETAQAESTGAAASTVSGRRGGSTKYCTSWRWEHEGNERFFTDKQDCYDSADKAPSGTKAELIYDPSDLGTVFVHSDNTVSKLKGTQTVMRIFGIAGVVVLIGSVASTVWYLRSRKKPETKVEQ